jgi:hypothetical protein
VRWVTTQEETEAKLVQHLTNSGNHQLSISLAKELAARSPMVKMDLTDRERRERQEELSNKAFGLKKA